MNYKNCVSELFKKIPEVLAWEPTIKEDEDSPYTVFGAFARFIRTKKLLKMLMIKLLKNRLIF